MSNCKFLFGYAVSKFGITGNTDEMACNSIALTICSPYCGSISSVADIPNTTKSDTLQASKVETKFVWSGMIIFKLDLNAFILTDVTEGTSKSTSTSDGSLQLESNFSTMSAAEMSLVKVKTVTIFSAAFDPANNFLSMFFAMILWFLNW